MPFKCPYCQEEFSDKFAHTNHIADHLLAKLRASYPGLIEMIEKVESEMPIKFKIQIDTGKAVFEEKLVENLLSKMEEDPA